MVHRHNLTDTLLAASQPVLDTFCFRNIFERPMTAVGMNLDHNTHKRFAHLDFLNVRPFTSLIISQPLNRSAIKNSSVSFFTNRPSYRPIVAGTKSSSLTRLTPVHLSLTHILHLLSIQCSTFTHSKSMLFLLFRCPGQALVYQSSRCDAHRLGKMDDRGPF